MKCSQCGRQISPRDRSCPSCGMAFTAPASAVPSAKTAKPIAGIVVSFVLGGVEVVWGFFGLYASLFLAPSQAYSWLVSLFPAFHAVRILGNSFALLGNSALIVGAWMSAHAHPKGGRVVRTTCWTMAGVVVVLSSLALRTTAGSPAWSTVNSQAKAWILGGAFGLLVAGLFQWAWILFLFRESR